MGNPTSSLNASDSANVNRMSSSSMALGQLGSSVGLGGMVRSSAPQPNEGSPDLALGRLTTLLQDHQDGEHGRYGAAVPGGRGRAVPGASPTKPGVAGAGPFVSNFRGAQKPGAALYLSTMEKQEFRAAASAAAYAGGASGGPGSSAGGSLAAGLGAEHDGDGAAAGAGVGADGSPVQAGHQMSGSLVDTGSTGGNRTTKLGSQLQAGKRGMSSLPGVPSPFPDNVGLAGLETLSPSEARRRGMASSVSRRGLAAVGATSASSGQLAGSPSTMGLQSVNARCNPNGSTSAHCADAEKKVRKGIVSADQHPTGVANRLEGDKLLTKLPRGIRGTGTATASAAGLAVPGMRGDDELAASGIIGKRKTMAAMEEMAATGNGTQSGPLGKVNFCSVF